MRLLVVIHSSRAISSTTPFAINGRLCAQAGTPGELVGVSRWILRCGLVHMKAGSILFDLSNHKIHSRILRYAFSYLNPRRQIVLNENTGSRTPLWGSANPKKRPKPSKNVNLDRTDTKRTCFAHLSNKWMPEMESLGDLRSKTLCLTCLISWSSAVTRLLATLQCESTEHMSSLERENRRRIGVPG